MIRKGILSLHHLLRSDNCIGFYLLDEEVINRMRHLSGNKPVYFLPDIIDEAEPDMSFSVVNDIRRKANGRKIVLLIGAIDRRKNTANFLRAAQKAEKEEYFFVVAGVISFGSFSSEDADFIKNISERSGDNIYIHNKRIETEAEFNAIVSICDILFAAYLDFPYSSNMIAKSAKYKKPIIVSKEFLMGELVNQYSLGITIDPDNCQNILDAIKHLLVENYFENTGYQQFLKKHSREMFSESLGRIMITAKSILNN